MKKRDTSVNSFNPGFNSGKAFTYLYSNADCLMNKRAELDALIEIHRPSVIGIVEVKPKNYRYNIQECEIALPGYEVFHNLDKEGRGMCLHIRQDLKPSLVSLDSSFEECIFASCQLASDETLVLGLVYRSPSSSEDNNKRLNDTVMSIADLKTAHLVVVGDFNFPDIDWQQERATVGENHPASKFYKATRDAYLIQHQMNPTRIRDGQRPTLDDLVFTNREDIIHDITMAGALGKSDHATILVNLAVSTQTAPKQERLNYHKADYPAMKKFLDMTDWKRELQNLTADQAWSFFKKKVEEAKTRFVPKTKQGGSTKKKWLDGGTLTSVRKKHKLYRRWLSTKSGQDYQEYAKARNKAARECRRAKIRLEATVAEQAKKNPKSFWSYVKSKTSTRTGISDLKKEDGTMAKTDRDKAEVLNAFFQSVFTREPDGRLPTSPHFEFDSELTDFDITKEDVRKLLRKLKTGKAAGLDGIPPLLLVETADSLALPVSIIFQKSLEEGRIPDDWRKASVTPIFKKGSRSSANNYRPVSLTSVLCKTMETMVRSKVMDHLQSNRLICQQQHGFTPGRSCVTQLLDTLDCWTEILDQGGSVDAVYMDFRKAFDSVPHRRLMQKVEAHGIRGSVYDWIRDFLTDRTQQVIVNGAASDEASVTSGIPQGSVLGPLLFVIYINDLPQHVQNEVRIFADDTKLFTESDQAEARATLQEDLDNLYNWSTDWLLKFHPEKCCTMRLGRCTEEHTYTMKGTDADGQENRHALAMSEAEKDLGVVIDRKLTFKNHVAQATAKANRTLGVIRRSFDHLTDHTFVQLYKTLVRPMLEYGHSVWQPSHKTLQQDVEDVQRRATKLIGKLKDKPYPERLATLKLPSLEHRRRRGDMIDLYKYMTGLYDTTRPVFEPHGGRETRGNSKKLAKRCTRLEVRSSFFSERVVSTWNGLPDSVVTAPSLNSFKGRLDAHWANHPNLYDPDCYH